MGSLDMKSGSSPADLCKINQLILYGSLHKMWHSPILDCSSICF
ncbi:hypothetical protein [Candidatus Liberibacter brunswickensis]